MSSQKVIQPNLYDTFNETKEYGNNKESVPILQNTPSDHDLSFHEPHSDNSTLPRSPEKPKIVDIGKKDIEVNNITKSNEIETTKLQPQSPVFFSPQVKVQKADLDSLAKSEIISKLEELQEEHNQLESKYKVELASLSRKYESLYKELYNKRNEILSAGESDQLEKSGPNKESTPTVKLPKFWLTCFKKHQILNLLVEKHDEPILACLRDVTSSWLDEDNQHSFKLSFFFNENQFFLGTILEKEFYLEYDHDVLSDVLTSSKSTIPNWYSDMNPTQQKTITHQKNIRTGELREIIEHKPLKSFFQIFQDTHFPTYEELERMTDKEAKQLQMSLASELEAGIAIRDSIIPHAIDWYLGKLTVYLSEEESSSYGSEDELLDTRADSSVWDYFF